MNIVCVCVCLCVCVCEERKGSRKEKGREREGRRQQRKEGVLAQVSTVSPTGIHMCLSTSGWTHQECILRKN